MLKTKFRMKAKVWLYSGMAGWHFITLPKTRGAYIKREFVLTERGWGSHRVTVTVGKTSWNTSIFPDKKAGSYVLPLKADVRKKENIKKGDTINFDLEMIQPSRETKKGRRQFKLFKEQI